MIETDKNQLETIEMRLKLSKCTENIFLNSRKTVKIVRMCLNQSNFTLKSVKILSEINLKRLKFD